MNIIIRYLLIAVLLVSGVAKLLDNELATQIIIEAFPGFQLKYYSTQVGYFVYAVAIYEIILGLLLLKKNKNYLTLFIITIIFFTGLLVKIKILGLDLSCGCFGKYIQEDINVSLIRNLVILLLSFYIYHKEYRAKIP